MPRIYKPDPRGKRYVKRTQDEFEPAFDVIRKGLSIRKAAERHDIPYTVLQRHYKRQNLKSQGGQTILTATEEALIIERILFCAEWGYPFDRTGLRLFIKSYLDVRGKTIKRFKNNTLGVEFIHGFLERHKSVLRERLCQNIKRQRAAISTQVITEYFDNLKASIDGVPVENIINYNETNLSDDPGWKKVITKRGCKYPERVMNTSKSANSIMFAGSADGKLLPVYVVYKSLHLYKTWMENGPPERDTTEVRVAGLMLYASKIGFKKSQFRTAKL